MLYFFIGVLTGAALGAVAMFYMVKSSFHRLAEEDGMFAESNFDRHGDNARVDAETPLNMLDLKFVK